MKAAIIREFNDGVTPFGDAGTGPTWPNKVRVAYYLHIRAVVNIKAVVVVAAARCEAVISS